MPDSSGPLIVRHKAATVAPAKPGLHSHNRTRRMPGAPRNARRPFFWLRTALLLLGLCAIGYCGYSASDQYIYQAYQNWAFDQQITGRRVAFADYLREKTPFGFLVGTRTPEPSAVRTAATPSEGALLGRVEISRLNLSAMVREGVDDKTLSLAVGHVPSTALPGQSGNFAIAAHRDTLFRALKDIRKNDLVTFQSPSGSYTYRVVATEIVKPSEVRVLQPDGGGLIAPPAQKLLTMITCYPFYYLGSAPKRFIVEAKLVGSDDTDKSAVNETQNTGPPPITRKAKPKAVKQALNPEPRVMRGSSVVDTRAMRGSSRVSSATPAPPAPIKKRGFWHRLFHL